MVKKMTRVEIETVGFVGQFDLLSSMRLPCFLYIVKLGCTIHLFCHGAVQIEIGRPGRKGCSVHTRGSKKYKNCACTLLDHTLQFVVGVGTTRLCPRLLLGHTVYQPRYKTTNQSLDFDSS